MEPIIEPVDKKLLARELTAQKFIRNSERCGNLLFEVTAENSPNVMREIGRLREISFRESGGGTGKSIDIDEFDTDKKRPYKQLIVFDPDNSEIIGGYRYLDCAGGIDPKKMATSELFSFSDDFINNYLPYTIELGRSFVQPMYQANNLKRKGIFALDNLWDGLGALTVKYENHKYFFGKATMYPSYNFRARNLLLNFLNIYFQDTENLVTPIEPLDYDFLNPYYRDFFKGLSYKEAYKILSKEVRKSGESIPPLINSYMNLSPNMKIFGTSINKGFGDVEETGLLVTIKDIYPEKIDRHITPLKVILAKIRNSSKWWKERL